MKRIDSLSMELSIIYESYNNNYLGGNQMAITMEMSKGAYEIAKKVYSKQLSRIQGAIEINKQTGMNEASAGAFITIFMGMMEGEVYKRAFNNPTNRFLLESIKKDY